jgi:hypothetical protein
MLRSLLLLSLITVGLPALPAHAQREIVGADDEDDGPPRTAPPAEEKNDDKKKAGDKKKKGEDKKKEDGKKKDDDTKKDVDTKKDDDTKKDVDKKKDNDKKKDVDPTEAGTGSQAPAKSAPPPKKDGKAGPVDVLADSDEDKAKRRAEDEAKKKADEAALAEEQKKAEEKKRLLEQKRLDEEKRLQETKADRLAAAKKQRVYRRTESDDVVVVCEVEPGAVTKENVVELRLEIFRPLDVADPRFGAREPYRDLNLVANVVEPNGKKSTTTAYAVHSLGAPGRYGFHFTPERDGVVQVQLSGDVSGRRLNVAIPLHVGVWPPPDFEDEDKKLFQ